MKAELKRWTNLAPLLVGTLGGIILTLVAYTIISLIV